MTTRFTIAFLLVILVTMSHQSPAAQPNDAAARAAIEEAVKAADTGMWEAVNACDEESWTRIVADDLVLIIIGGTTFDKATLHEDFFGKSMHPVPCDTEYTNEPMKVRSYGDAAVVTGNLAYKGNGKGRPRATQRFVYTRVFEKRNGTWQLVLGQHTTTKERQEGPF